LAGFKADQITFTGNARKLYHSSPGVGRAFCGDCGTPLTWEGDAGDLGPFCEIHLCTFDDPEALLPTAHAFDSERISWFDVVDQLPRYKGGIMGNSPVRHGPDNKLG
jgi:hypothetical protein